MRLLDPVTFGPRTAPNRVMFGPHVTNLGDDDRRLTERHVAYYARRARGWVRHDRDRGRERARVGLAVRAGAARRTVPRRVGVDRRRLPPHGALVIAALDHAGGQGSSAYNQRPLWAPSRVPEVNTREVPKWMEAGDIERRRRRVRERRQARRRGRVRRCRDQRRTAQPRAPVPQRAHEPARRRVGARSQPVRATGDRGGPRQRSRPDRRAAPVVRRARAVGRHHARAGPGDRRRPRRIGRRLPRRRARLDLLVREDPTRLPRADRVQHRAVPHDPRRRSTCRSSCRVRSSTSVRPSGRSATTPIAAVCDAVEMTRAQIADPDLVAKIGA